MSEAENLSQPPTQQVPHERVVTLLRERIAVADKIILLLTSGEEVDRMGGELLARRYMAKYADDIEQRNYECAR